MVMRGQHWGVEGHSLYVTQMENYMLGDHFIQKMVVGFIFKCGMAVRGQS